MQLMQPGRKVKTSGSAKTSRPRTDAEALASLKPKARLTPRSIGENERNKEQLKAMKKGGKVTKMKKGGSCR